MAPISWAMMYPGTRRHGKSPRSEKATLTAGIQVGAGYFAHKQDDRHHHQPGRDDYRAPADAIGKCLPVGVGSVGTRDLDRPLPRRRRPGSPLPPNQGGAAVGLERFVGKSEYPNHGQRVVTGQRLMQAATDIFIGWRRVRSPLDGQERDFYVRQLNWKGSLVIEALGPPGLAAYGKVCGWTLARAHARSGDRIAISAYLGKSDAFDRAMASFAETFATRRARLRGAPGRRRLGPGEGRDGCLTGGRHRRREPYGGSCDLSIIACYARPAAPRGGT